MSTQPIRFAPAPSISLDEKYHHQWFLVDALGAPLTALECEPLAQLQIQAQLGQLQLRAPGMLRLELMLDVLEDDDEVRCTVQNENKEPIPAIDEGQLAAVWFEHVLGQPCRLVKKDPGHPDA